MCALDASIGNRAKENYHLDVDYSSIYGTSEINQIRKLISLEIAIMKNLKLLSVKQKDILKDEMENLLKMSDTDLHKERVKCSSKLKDIVKPQFEVYSYNIADDNTIIINFMNNNTKKTENILIQLKDYGNIDNYIKFLINKLVELQEAKKRDNNLYKKKLELLIQISDKENANEKKK
ncbi:hypothetical protein FDG50_07745 [Clostridium botulinum]|uniref:hypothetical protein n=1 Tax=Clostridium botulinum TaxID=1491 RepID=UPI001400B0B3|nr:hypothetical protein [Clostridium botulinum]MBY6838320.1 hypothetical protein [Clostridium botulinum]NFG64999.1 hypothetical protein [Clostridium botulinum]NFQ24011.1 hypothetical protein [Clostridium botulinum]